ncbi:hypothetical protein [Carboxylicivirga sp. RSCT41]|uniref:hypothetical protein n=1 Tax=Carboxylicivirga agarovorans TaxID=3417570 RepID=UPI003D3530A0
MKKRYWQPIAKAFIILCSVLAYGYIIRKLVNFEHWHTLSTSFKLSGSTIVIIFLLVLLWFMNLSFEAKKWQVLMQAFIRLRFKDAWCQIMAGTTTAVGSPARIAEMGGRMALLPKQQRLNAAIMTSIGGIFQNLVIISAGVISLVFSPDVSKLLKLPLELGELVLFLLGISGLITLGLRIVFPQKFRYYFRIFVSTKRIIVLKSLFWTCLRYLTYITQLYFWLNLWGLNSGISEYLALASTYFFMITIIPSHILVDMGIRGSIAIFLFTPFFTSSPLILAATFCLWLSNVIIPTLLGSYILVQQKLLKQLVKQKET